MRERGRTGDDRAATIVVLNGTSSAGKTTLARELQTLLPEPYLHVEADRFALMVPGARYSPAVYVATICAMHTFVAHLAASGLNAVVDHLLTTRTWLQDCADKLAGHRAFLVAVRCPPEELEWRERARGDRRVGQGRDQIEFVHAHGVYDFEVDTAEASPSACAGRIVAWLATQPTPDALRRLRGSEFLRDQSAYGWVLLRGSTGPGVRRLQDDLRRLGHDPGPADGVFGPRTEEAVKAFQAAHGLRPEGAVFPRTIKALREALGPASTESAPPSER